MSSTAENIITYALNILRTDGDSTDVPALQESFLLTLVSQAKQEWLRAHRRGGTEPIASFREHGYDLISDTSLGADSTATATSLTLEDSSEFAASGMGIVWDDNMPDLFAWTANDLSTALTGVTGLSFAHEEGDTVQTFYALPSTFKKFRASEEYGDGCKVNGAGYTFMQGPPTGGHFSMYDDGTTKYLWLPKGLTGSASILYEKTSTTIDSTDDTLDIPSEYDFFIVWRVVQTATIPKEGGQPTQLYLTAKTEANKLLNESLKDRNTGRYVRVRQFHPYTNLRDSSYYTSR